MPLTKAQKSQLQRMSPNDKKSFTKLIKVFNKLSKDYKELKNNFTLLENVAVKVPTHNLNDRERQALRKMIIVSRNIRSLGISEGIRPRVIPPVRSDVTTLTNPRFSKKRKRKGVLNGKME